MRTVLALKSCAFLIAVVLTTVVASPLAAQQAVRADPTPASAPAAATAETPAGPRVRAEMRPVEATISDGREPATFHRKKETIVLSTLALVLIVVLLVLLIA